MMSLPVYIVDYRGHWEQYKITASWTDQTNTRGGFRVIFIFVGDKNNQITEVSAATWYQQKPPKVLFPLQVCIRINSWIKGVVVEGMCHWYCLLPLLSKLLCSNKSAGRTNRQRRPQCNHAAAHNLLPSPSCFFIVSSLSLEECRWFRLVSSEAMKSDGSSHQPSPSAPLQTRAHAPTWLKAADMDWWACPRLIELSSIRTGRWGVKRMMRTRLNRRG